MSLHDLAYRFVNPALGAVARNRWLIRRLFSVRVPSHITVHFDPTTLLLFRVLLDTITPDDERALEVGIGSGALISLGLQKRTHLQLEGVDCSESRVASSRAVAAYNQLTAHFTQSDLFSRLASDRRYDLIFFNPPYVPTGHGQRLQLTRRMRADHDGVWDGGVDGTAVLRQFLTQVPDHVSARGRVLFGVQPIFVSADTIKELIAASQLDLVAELTRCYIPSRVYVLRRRNG